jgi:hypothetical protein
MSTGTFKIATVEPANLGKPLSIDHLDRVVTLAQDIRAAQLLNDPIRMHD